MKITRILMILLACTLLVAGLSCSRSSYQLAAYVVEGQGSVSPQSGIFASGSTVTLTASPESGWEFDHWGGQASGSQNPISITMNSDKTVYAYLVENSASFPTPTPTATITSQEVAYDTAREQIQTAVGAYAAANAGNLPLLTGTATVNGITVTVINMSALLTTNGGTLRALPYGTYGSIATDGSDNCATNPACAGCSTSAHYIWYVDNGGSVYSTCTGTGCLATGTSGYQGVWP